MRAFDNIELALKNLVEEFNSRPGGMIIREVAGGFRMTTRPEHHEFVRAYLKSRPNAKLSMAALETLAVVAYKQPVTLAEILAIRGKEVDLSRANLAGEKTGIYPRAKAGRGQTDLVRDFQRVSDTLWFEGPLGSSYFGRICPDGWRPAVKFHGA